MKRYFIPIVLLAVLIAVNHVDAKAIYPIGCTAKTVYSATTGLPCSNNSVASRTMIYDGYVNGMAQIYYAPTFQQALQEYNSINNDITDLNTGICPTDLHGCGLNAYGNTGNIYNSGLIYMASNMLPELQQSRKTLQTIAQNLTQSFENTYCNLNSKVTNYNDRIYCQSLFNQ